MGWWPFSEDTRQDAIRTGTAIPNREERTLCWAARDAYFMCLDANNILDANKDASAAAKACPKQSADFERDCSAAWVKYFKQWRVADLQKKRRLEELRKQGAVEMEVSSKFAPEGGAGTGAGAKGGKGKGDIQDMLDQKRGR